MLRDKLRRHLMTFAIGPLLIMGILAVPQLLKLNNETSYNQLLSASKHATSGVETFFSNNVDSAVKFSKNRSFYSLLTPNTFDDSGAFSQEVQQTNALLKQQVAGITELDACMIIDKYDVVRASSFTQFVGRTFSKDYMDYGSVGTKPYISNQQLAGTLVGWPWNHDVVMVAVPIVQKGETLGRLVCFYNVEHLKKTSSNSSDENASVAIFDQSGELVADGSKLLTPAVLATTSGQTITDEIKKLDDGSSKVVRFVLRINGKKYDCVVQRTSIAKWPIISFADRNIMRFPIYRTLIILCIAACMCVLIAYWAAQRILEKAVGPIDARFLPAIYKVAGGDRKARIVYDRDDEIGMVARALNDLMADLGEREVELRASEARYRIVIEGNDYMVFEWDDNTDSLVISDLFIKHFGYDPDLTRASQTMRKTKYVHPDDIAEYEKFCDDIFSRCVDSSAVFRLRRINGEYTWIRGKSVALYNQINECYGAIGMFADVDAIKKEELKLTEQVRTDTVSQVLTRKAFEETTVDMMQKVDSGELPDRQLYICFVDIDEFKEFNTRYGHSFGDRVIRFFGEVLKKSVGLYGFAGRVGGDEFALCFAVGQDEPSVDKIVASIHEQLSIGLRTRDSEENIVITASIGTARYPQDGEAYEVLMHKADLDMYERKQIVKTQNRLQELKNLESIGVEEPT